MKSQNGFSPHCKRYECPAFQARRPNRHPCDACIDVVCMHEPSKNQHGLIHAKMEAIVFQGD